MTYNKITVKYMIIYDNGIYFFEKYADSNILEKNKRMFIAVA